MPKTKPEIEAVRSSERKRITNKAVKSRIRSQVAEAEDLIITGDSTEATKAVREAISLLDSAVPKGVLHINNSSRKKSRLIKKLTQKFSAPTAEAKQS